MAKSCIYRHSLIRKAESELAAAVRAGKPDEVYAWRDGAIPALRRLFNDG
jgi:hypothetical protein